MPLNDKVALITGAASGIGREIALQYARAGARVVIADIALDAAHQVVRDIQAAEGEAMAIAMDVTKETDVDEGVAKAVAHFGRLDILISNAGVQIIRPIVEASFYDWKTMLAIHLDGAFLTTRAAMRVMVNAGKGGTIIYMGSVHSHEASPLKAPYVTAKHGLLGLARVVAKEGAKDGIRAHVICPGFVRTPLVDQQIPEQAKNLGLTEAQVIQNVMLKNTVDGEFTTLNDVAQMALFLAAYESNALTGQSFMVSHGWCMQ